MKPSLQRVLLGVQTELDPTLILHKKIAKILYRTGDIQGVSGVYQFTSGDEEGLTAVYSLRTMSPPFELKKQIDEILRPLASSRAQIEILIFEDLILRSPGLVLPSVNLHRLKRWCLPAADLWGEYNHPVEGKDLKTLSEITGSLDKIEFYTQSKTLLDFLSRET